MCRASSRNSAAVAIGALLIGSDGLCGQGAPAACEKLHGLADVCIHGLYGETITGLGTLQTLLTGARWHGAACFAPRVTSGSTVAAAGARKGSNWRYLNLGVTIPCRNTERTPVQQLRVREPPGSQPPRRQVVVAHPVVLAPTAADGLEHRVGNQHDLTHRPGGLDPVSSSALPARPPHPSCRMRARIWRSVRSRHAGAAPPSRYRSQVIRRNHDGKALNGSSRASAGVGRGSLP